MAGWSIRPECPGDAGPIGKVVDEAFAPAEHSDGGEARLIERLRTAGDLAISLVAVTDRVVGHAAFSPVRIADGSHGWFGLGPVAVLPAWQGRGIGAELVRAGIALLRERSAGGCVVLGNPAYYSRFGFLHDPALTYPGPPARFFQRLVLGGPQPSGLVTYAAAFG